jgi:hypothetical protein
MQAFVETLKGLVDKAFGDGVYEALSEVLDAYAAAEDDDDYILAPELRPGPELMLPLPPPKLIS